MTQEVDPFVIQWPQEWLDDPTLSPVLFYLNRFLHDLWLRTGGTDDAVTELQIGELYETGIESALSSELERELDEDAWQPHFIEENDEEVFTPVITRQWHKRIVTNSTDAADYEMYMVGQGAKISFPEFPDVDSEIILINNDGSRITANGNGHKIKVKTNTEDAVSWQTAGKSVHFHWFEDGPYWVAI